MDGRTRSIGFLGSQVVDQKSTGHSMHVCVFTYEYIKEKSVYRLLSHLISY